ncbi:hypothetical protein FJ443_15040 [Mesorhizobium sp. B2-6-1]|nr:hypothetical protein FJ443_15040 [Mesorhizobium sp. B2-6-1]
MNETSGAGTQESTQKFDAPELVCPTALLPYCPTALLPYCPTPPQSPPATPPYASRRPKPPRVRWRGNG